MWIRKADDFVVEPIKDLQLVLVQMLFQRLLFRELPLARSALVGSCHRCQHKPMAPRNLMLVVLDQILERHVTQITDVFLR